MLDEKMEAENMEEEAALQAQVEQLQAEVSELQRRQQDNQRNMTFHFSGHMQDALSLLSGPSRDRPKEQVVASKLRDEVEEMEEDLRRQTETNGIALDSCSVRTLQRCDSKLIQQISVSGRCSDVVLQVEFQLSDIKQGERAERTISDLSVVMDSGDLQSFGDFLSGMEESSDLLLLFRSLRSFSGRSDERRRTFQHFLEKYPSIVSLPGGCRSKVMTLNHPELPGCVISIHWLVDVSKEGEVSSRINLLTKIPEKALQLFPSQAVGGSADAFQSLLRLLGPEAALECVIRAVGLLQQTDGTAADLT